MADEISSDVIKKTQKSLGKYIKKPALPEKLLKKPPFRFLHDIVHSIIIETGFLKGLYSEDELNSDNVKEKEAKIAFLNKLIDATKSLSQANLSVKASKIVAGLDPVNTNLLLQTLCKCIDNNVDSSRYVSQLNTKIIKKQKDDKVLNKNKNTKVSLKKDKDSARKEVTHKTGRRGREDKILKCKESQKSIESPKVNNNSGENLSDSVVDKKDSPNQVIEESVVNIETPALITDIKNDYQKDKKIENNEAVIINKSEENKNSIRPKSAKSKTDEISTKPDEKPLPQLSKSISRPKSSLRPPSVRPSSARPGAPRLRPDSSYPIKESINMGNINVIIDNSNVDDEDTVVIENVDQITIDKDEIIKENNVKTIDDLDNKGHLVESILESLQKNGKKTQLDYESQLINKNKELNSKEMNQLSNLIDNLTKSALPLGKLINYLHEDIEAMTNELQLWSKTKKQLYYEINKQKRSSAESNKPLLSQLESINRDIGKIRQEITLINCNILKNERRLSELLFK